MLDQPEKQVELDRMKRFATGLLVGVTFIFVAAVIGERYFFWISFVRAFAEAAMVGAIADWFAVTALFRHPLNLKIPHTAIIPNKQDSIARSFGAFVQNNFLSQEIITGKLRSMDVARNVIRWLSQPQHSQRVAGQLAAMIAAVIQVVKDEDVQALIERGLVTRARTTPVAPLLGRLLALITAGERQQEVEQGLVQLVARLLNDNKEKIRERIRREMPRFTFGVFNDAIYTKIVGTIDETLREIYTNPEHSFHRQFADLLNQFIENLKHSPEMIARGEALKEELLLHPAVRDFSLSLWIDIKTALLYHAANPESDFREPIERAISTFGEGLLHDDALLEKIDGWVEQAARYLIEVYGHEVAHLIAQTISNWDAEAISNKIELQVGRDLQYIRINGTVVGGIAGVVIYGCSLLL